MTEGLINPNLPKNIKQKVRKELHPEGHSFEAVQLLKTRLDKKDPLYIFDMNDSHFNSDRPTFVFTTNLRDCLYSSWETTNASKLTLIDAVYDNVADSVKLAAYEKLLGDGSVPPPGEPMEPTRQARERERQ